MSNNKFDMDVPPVLNPKNYEGLSDNDMIVKYLKAIYKETKEFEMALKGVGYDENHSREFVAGILTLALSRYNSKEWE